MKVSFRRWIIFHKERGFFCGNGKYHPDLSWTHVKSYLYKGTAYRALKTINQFKDHYCYELWAGDEVEKGVVKGPNHSFGGVGLFDYKAASKHLKEASKLNLSAEALLAKVIPDAWSECKKRGQANFFPNKDVMNRLREAGFTIGRARFVCALMAAIDTGIEAGNPKEVIQRLEDYVKGHGK